MTDYICQEKGEETWIYRYEKSSTTFKENKEQITATSNITDNIKTNRTTITKKKNKKKNNCMDISSDKRLEFYPRRPACG